MTPTYKKQTVWDLVKFVIENKDVFPKGIHTEITSGDFEGNYTHQSHELQSDGCKVCLAYEMHEGQN